MNSYWHWWRLVQTQPYIWTASFNKTSARHPSARTTTRWSYTSIEEAWGEFRACSRAHKRSPRLVENGHGVRRSAQLREPRTLQCFCWIASAHLSRNWGDEAVDEYGRTSRRRRLSQGRDLHWLNSSSNTLYELRTWHNNTMAANRCSMC